MKDKGMDLRLYNTLTKQEEVFQPTDPKRVTMYTCGPTVYGRPHIGNYSSFLMADLLRRWLEAGHGLHVVYAKNITDVGHLARDRDEGEDKIEQQAREEHGSVSHESVIAIARKYEEQYLEDEYLLNIRDPDYRPRASEYVEQMKEMIEELLSKGIAYVTADGMYFDVTKFPQYGALSGNSLDNLAAGARVEINEGKRHPADFALWKFCVGPNEHHALRWKSPGKSTLDGFPGWHIECSAMSRALLGDTIDLHTGGEDNIFPHHECEIAQSESVTGKKPFVQTWLHKRRIDLDGEKMSKSLGNILTIPHIIERGYSPLDLRYYLLSVHYRTNLKFSWKGMDDSKIARAKIIEWMNEAEKYVDRLGAEEVIALQDADVPSEGFTVQFTRAMNQDLNTPAALATLFDAMKYYRNLQTLSAAQMLDAQMLIECARQTFVCFESPLAEAISDEAQKLVQERDAARAQKDFTASDRLRAELEAMGYEVKDMKEGTVIRRL